MAGHRLRAVVVQALESRVRAELDEGATVLDYVCGWLEGGDTMVALGRDLAEELNTKIPKNLLHNYLRSKYGEEGETRLAHARSVGATMMVDEAREIIDDADDSSREKLQHAQMKANMRTWTAERFNRSLYGQPKQGSVTINVGHLHLDALRQRAAAANPLERAIHGTAEVTGQLGSGVIDIAADIPVEPDIVIDSAATT